MLTKKILISILAALLVAAPVVADELTQIVQQDLHALGYDPGSTDGEMTMQTAIAISKFQAEHDLEVTGESSPQLAGVLKAAGRGQYQPPTATTAPVAQSNQVNLQAQQQACLQEKMAEAQAKQKKKRGFGSLMRAVSRTATQFGNNDLAQTISATSYDIYNVNATAADLESAAKDLGLTTDEMEECRNPPAKGN